MNHPSQRFSQLARDFVFEIPSNSTGASLNATFNIHTAGANFEIPTSIGSTQQILTAHGCLLTCSLGPCTLKCARQATNLIGECGCEFHEATVDSVAFSGHMRHYLTSIGIDTSHMTSSQVCDFSLQTLEKIVAREPRPINLNSNA